MFSTCPKTNLKFSVSFILSSANAFNLDQSKRIVVWYRVKELRKIQRNDERARKDNTRQLFYSVVGKTNACNDSLTLPQTSPSFYVAAVLVF